LLHHARAKAMQLRQQAPGSAGALYPEMSNRRHGNTALWQLL